MRYHVRSPSSLSASSHAALSVVPRRPRRRPRALHRRPVPLSVFLSLPLALPASSTASMPVVSTAAAAVAATWFGSALQKHIHIMFGA